jgi:hypothetical protein
MAKNVITTHARRAIVRRCVVLTTAVFGALAAGSGGAEEVLPAWRSSSLSLR